MSENRYIISQVESFKNKYNQFNNYQDYKVFTALCLKYYYFSEAGVSFDPEIIDEYICDGSGDGGIDAIFNDPTSEHNDLIIVQSKYYNSAHVTQEQIIGEISKVYETIKNLDRFRVEGYSQKMVTAYKNAVNNMEDDAEKKFVFFTCDNAPSKRDKNKMRKTIEGYFSEFDVELNFAEDIQSEIELADSTKTRVDSDKLEIDEKDNFLKYEDSIIVNVSAKSLQDLQNRKRNGLLGMNLRYHVKNKKVDDGITSTIENDPSDFWYKNNGILIVCDDYELDGKVLKIKNFSIVNGGQTTYKIGNTDLPDSDFYLQCKVVKIKGITSEETEKFAASIAEATNSQKPIKTKDLKANAPEQWELRNKLAECGVYYVTKSGDKVPNQYSEPYQSTTLEAVGKVGLAGILQMPGSARSNSTKMYDDAYYYQIFGSSFDAQVIADLIKIDYYYDKFRRSDISSYPIDTTQPMIRNGKTACIASIMLLSKIRNGAFTYEEVVSKIDDTDELKKVIRKMDGVDSVIKARLDNEQEVFNQLFGLIGDEVLGNRYEFAKELRQSENKDLTPSNYLKVDTNYYRDIIKRLYSVYSNNHSFRELVDKII